MYQNFKIENKISTISIKKPTLKTKKLNFWNGLKPLKLVKKKTLLTGSKTLKLGTWILKCETKIQY